MDTDLRQTVPPSPVKIRFSLDVSKIPSTRIKSIEPDQNFLDNCLGVLTKLRNNPFIGPFLHPVPKDLYPDYYDIVSKAIDLATIEINLREGLYNNTLEDFFDDIRLMFENCRTYNASTSIIVQRAKEIECILEDEIVPELTGVPSIPKAASSEIEVIDVTEIGNLEEENVEIDDNDMIGIEEIAQLDHEGQAETFDGDLALEGEQGDKQVTFAEAEDDQVNVDDTDEEFFLLRSAAAGVRTWEKTYIEGAMPPEDQDRCEEVLMDLKFAGTSFYFRKPVRFSLTFLVILWIT